MPQDLQNIISQFQTILNTIISILQIIATFLIAFLVVLWLTLCFWTFRDIQSRSRDVVAQVFATLLVVFFNIPGVLIYMLVRPKHTLEQEYEGKLQEEYMLQDLEEREICPTCRTKTQPDFLFCFNCRTRLRKECAGCGQIIKLKWMNCPYCGIAQKPPTRETNLTNSRLALSPRSTVPPRRPATSSTAIVPENYNPNGPATPPRQPTTARLRVPSLQAGYEEDTTEQAGYQTEEQFYQNGQGEADASYERFKPRPNHNPEG